MGWPRYSLAPVGPDRRDTGRSPARLSWAGLSSVPMQCHFIDKSGGQRLSAGDVDAELKKYNDIHPDQMRVIQARFSHGRDYILSNTIAAARRGELPVPMPGGAGAASARETAGFVNPPHFHASVIDIHRQAALSPRPAGRSEREWLESPSRRFETFTPTHTHAPIVVHGHSNTVLGHHAGAGAVDMWNRFGHTQPRVDNKDHNYDAARYHGLEEREASARSGGHTKERYQTPTPTSSHPSHWDPTHPQYYPRNHWKPLAQGGGAAAAASSAAAAPVHHQGGQPMPPVPSPATLLSLPYMPAPAPVPQAWPAMPPLPPLAAAFPAVASPKPIAGMSIMSSGSAFHPYAGPAASSHPPISTPASRADDEDDPMGM